VYLVLGFKLVPNKPLIFPNINILTDVSILAAKSGLFTRSKFTPLSLRTEVNYL
jgi:hypothetical protein